MTRWNWIGYKGVTYRQIGHNKDGSLYNPNGYPEDVVLAVTEWADAERKKRRSDAAKKAAETRRKRHERHVYEVTKRITEGHVYGPATHCVVCKRSIDDPKSVERGIGSDCWQDILRHLERPRDFVNSGRLDVS